MKQDATDTVDPASELAVPGPPWSIYEILTEDEAALYLRYDVATLRRWRREGGGPHYVKSRPGRAGRITYRLDALRAWTLERERQAT